MTSQPARPDLHRSRPGWVARRVARGRVTAPTAVVACLVVAASAVSVPAAPAASAASAVVGRPAVTGQTRPAPASPLRQHAVTHPAGPAAVPARHPVWPAAAGSTVTVPARGWVAVAGTPVTLSDAGPGVAARSLGVQRRVRVDVAARAAASAAGVGGPVVTVSTASGQVRPVRVSMDVAGVAAGYGGDWASRAVLVQLTGCTVTGTGAGQRVSGCTGRTPLPTSRSAATLTATVIPAAATPVAAAASTTSRPSTARHTLTAVNTATAVDTATAVNTATAVDTVAAVDAAATTRSAGVAAAAAGTRGVTVLAATATAAGTTGSYAATPLSPASSWQAGGPSGSFTWSYPVTVPPVAGGLAPTVSIGYDSGSVDGRVATTNNQPSWVGDGFDLSSGFIERRYVACSQDMAGGNNTVKTGDLCWKSDNATISLGSRSGPLVKDAKTGTWTR